MSSHIRRILEAGCHLEYDGFGQAVYHIPYAGKVLNRLSDMRRLEAIAEWIAEGYRDRIIIGQGYCFKCVLASYGGHSYHHILVNLLPVMKAVGLSEDDIHALLVDNRGGFSSSRRPPAESPDRPARRWYVDGCAVDAPTQAHRDYAGHGSRHTACRSE
ncbi:MAG: hypothetical protein JW990_10955 [Thermoleophilia bacterium]|nr:hypothetical protein [Thermoleophilia bacterium]